MDQRETLDLCVQFANEHLDDIITETSSVPMLTPELAEGIIARNEKFKDTYYNEHESFANSDDEDIYNY